MPYTPAITTASQFKLQTEDTITLTGAQYNKLMDDASKTEQKGCDNAQSLTGTQGVDSGLGQAQTLHCIRHVPSYSIEDLARRGLNQKLTTEEIRILCAFVVGVNSSR